MPGARCGSPTKRFCVTTVNNGFSQTFQHHTHHQCSHLPAPKNPMPLPINLPLPPAQFYESILLCSLQAFASTLTIAFNPTYEWGHSVSILITDFIQHESLLFHPYFFKLYSCYAFIEMHTAPLHLYIDHSFKIYSHIFGHLDCFHILTIVLCSNEHMCAYVLLNKCFYVLGVDSKKWYHWDVW